MPTDHAVGVLVSKEPAWHTLTPHDALAQLHVQSDHGLAVREAATRLRVHGPNRLQEQPPRSAWRVFIAQFKSLLILILAFAAVLAASVGQIKDAVVILAVLVLNAMLGFYQEYRAEQSLSALRSMLPRRARVRRAGRIAQVGAEQIAPGDVVLLEAGERVPADGRLLTTIGLELDESALTGESVPTPKDAAPVLPKRAALAERRNMAFMNTMVTRGRAELVVTATGMGTEIGRIAVALAAAKEGPSPLQVQLDQLGKRLAVVALVLVGIFFVFALARGDTLVHVMIDSIALAVAAMPEGLPAVVTVALALGMRRMARERAIVKRLAAVETLGSATVICSDKTGTLTLNQMTVRAFFFGGERFTVSGEGYSTAGRIQREGGDDEVPELRSLLMPATLCNDARLRDGQLIGDPTEGALLALAGKGGLQRDVAEGQLPRIAEIPFDAAHKFMATFHHEHDLVRAFVKGAPDVLIARCSRFMLPRRDVPLDAVLEARIADEYRRLADRGLRVLMIASRDIPAEHFDLSGSLMPYVAELTFVGLVGIVDPPRPEAREAIAQCRRAGIQVKMITGDHKDTALAIARDLGLHGAAVSGADLDGMDPHALAAIIEDVAVFARVAPDHKVKIVQALKERGHVVAMTGDGVNDAPALKAADIGVAMGGAGTEVAKEAATMVLTDDNFATIVRAVREGRRLYDNILKFVRFQLSTTSGAILTVFIAPIIGLPEPFNPIQILWVALIMDGPPAVALALDHARPGIMAEPPRRAEAAMLTLRRLGKILAFGATMAVGTIGVLYYGLQTASVEQAMTLAFTTFVLFQFFNVFNARAERGSSFNRHFFANRMLWTSLLGVLALQALAVHWGPAQAIFRTVALTTPQWLIAIAVGASVLVLEEARKAVRLRPKTCGT